MPMHILRTDWLRAWLLGCAALVLVACGGGGGGGSDGGDGSGEVPPPAADFLDDPALDALGFTSFESGPVRPLALSADGATLLAANTPDNRLEIYDVSGAAPALRASVPVGLEPVAVALRGSSEAWVVNHLSDSVSIVDLAAMPPRVKQTLWVGDEPRDIVFAGTGREYAFVTTAHRGQNAPFDPQLKTPGIGRADVWVFDAASPGAGAGTPAKILTLFGDTPRPLAVTPDRKTVYAGIHFSGNRSTVLFNDALAGGLDKPGPQASADGVEQPVTGLIVKYDGERWLDSGDPENGEPPRDWSERVRFELPDYDVFPIDAATLETGTPVAGVGTTLFAMAVRPGSGELFVGHLEARNEVRFEGSGERSTTVRGHFAESRIAVVDGSGAVRQRHLNKHIASYDAPLGTEAERALSLAMPSALAFSADGATLYVAAFGSQALGVFDAAKLADDSFVRGGDMIALSAGGPGGLALDAGRGRLYVLTRFDNGLSVVDTARRSEVAHVRMHNPEPAIVVAGRPFLYDAKLGSSRGDSACAGCHIFGDMDHLAWDLGIPEDSVAESPNAYGPTNRFQQRPSFHPMKGPMTTQSLRGLAGNGPMHWRGDRTGVSRDADESIEEQAFEDFNVAFVSLLGRESELSSEQIDAFARFALEIRYPPNPIANLDHSLSADQAAGREFFMTRQVDGGNTCNDCHRIDAAAGDFGTSSLQSAEGPIIDEDFKIPHFRNLYQKVGRFGSTGNPNDGEPQMGPQIRGFGFQHEGVASTVEEFLSAALFLFPDDQTRLQVESFVLALSGELAPIVGQQVSYSALTAAEPGIDERVALLVERALVTAPRPECDLVVKGVFGGQARGYVMNAQARFLPDRAAGEVLDLTALLALAAEEGNVATFTCVPPGSGARIGVDRDADGVLDGDESSV
ncbi:MAG: hypothetical protein AB1651_07180 [Pseudomonadota bacterium]